MSEAKSVVVTGSTRGLGLALAEAFLASGCHVTICSRGADAVEKAKRELVARAPDAAARIHGRACDITALEDLRALWDEAARATGRVDIWINNAGTGAVQKPIVEQSYAELAQVVETNLLGTVIATKLAAEKMLAQGGGQIFNTEGFGADGRMRRMGMAVYGATKTATRYLTRSIADELKGTPVRIGTIEPGVVATDMLVSIFDGVPQAQWEESRKFYNIIGDEPSTVAPWIAAQVLANQKPFAKVSWFSLPKMFVRFVSPTYRKRDLFAGKPPPKTV